MGQNNKGLGAAGDNVNESIFETAFFAPNTVLSEFQLFKSSFQIPEPWRTGNLTELSLQRSIKLETCKITHNMLFGGTNEEHIAQFMKFVKLTKLHISSKGTDLGSFLIEDLLPVYHYTTAVVRHVPATPAIEAVAYSAGPPVVQAVLAEAAVAAHDEIITTLHTIERAFTTFEFPIPIDVPAGADLKFKILFPDGLTTRPEVTNFYQAETLAGAPATMLVNGRGHYMTFQFDGPQLIK